MCTGSAEKINLKYVLRGFLCFCCPLCVTYFILRVVFTWGSLYLADNASHFSGNYFWSCSESSSPLWWLRVSQVNWGVTLWNLLEWLCLSQGVLPGELCQHIVNIPNRCKNKKKIANKMMIQPRQMLFVITLQGGLGKLHPEFLCSTFLINYPTLCPAFLLLVGKKK